MTARLLAAEGGASRPRRRPLPTSTPWSRRSEARGCLDILVVADGYNATAGAPTNGAAARPRLGAPRSAGRDLLHVATAVLPQMERQGTGDIVTIALVAGRVLRAGTSGLASARVALEVAALCDTLRQRPGSRGVRVAAAPET